MQAVSVRLDFIKELSDALPRAADMFTKTYMSPDQYLKTEDIHVLDRPYVSHFTTEHRDLWKNAKGPIPGLPVINLGEHGRHCLLPKGLLFRYQRHVSRLKKLLQADAVPPVLEKGILDRIIQASMGFLINSDKIDQYKVRLKRGLLLGGPPGNGKTMACKWLQKLCNDHNIAYNIVTSPELENAFGHNRLTEVVSGADVTFFDDIDVLFLSRGIGGDSRMACAFAAALDGFGREKYMVRIFTTNEDVSAVDPAFKRPGRIDQWFNIGLPTEELRLTLIKTWHTEIIESINPKNIAVKTETFSFAELKAVKAALVTNKIFGITKGWDLERALQDFLEYKPNDLKKRPVGFETEEVACRRRISVDHEESPSIAVPGPYLPPEAYPPPNYPQPA